MAKNEGKKKNKTLRKILLFGGIFLLGVGLIFIGIIGGRILKLRANAKEIMKNVNADTFRQTETSVIYDKNGEVISTLSGIKDLYYLKSEDIPDILKKMFVQIEDQDFYSHKGIDFSAIVRAAIANLKHGTIKQGASTITQQLAKNMFLTQKVTWNRKITEMFVAKELEKKFSKDQILEFYINNIYYANGFYGIEAAAQGYFATSVSNLSISQLAFLAGIPKNPSGYDPYVHFDVAMERRDSVLKQIFSAGIITSLEYYQAIEEDIVLTSDIDERYNYIETYVFKCATKALMKENGFVFRYEFEDAEDEAAYKELYNTYYSEYQTSLFTGGYRIYTSIDMEKQALLQDILDDKLKNFTDVNEEGIYDLQGAGVCIDNDTGLVTAIVGGRTQEYEGYTFNRAFQSYRQSGSSIKPLLVYAPYLMAGHLPEEEVDDSYMPGGPKNSGDLYRGFVSLKEALGYSSNVVAWKLMEQLTPYEAMQYLHKMNYEKIAVDDNNQATSVGGFTYGVSPVELASGYAALENDGVYREPTCVSRITNARGENIVDNPGEGYAVYNELESKMVTKMMEWGVNEGILQHARLTNAIVAAKSGTSNDNKDGWLAGYSKYYTTVVWVGCDMPKSVEGLSGGSYPLDIWKSFMYEIHKGLNPKEFPDYQDQIPEDKDYPYDDEEETTESSTAPGGANTNYGDGDTPNDVTVDGMGDKDYPLGY